MKTRARSSWMLVFILTCLVSLACSLPFLSSNKVDFTALETNAQATSYARSTQEVVSGAAATAIFQSIQATNTAITNNPTPELQPSATVQPSPVSPDEATAIYLSTALAQSIQATSAAQIAQATQAANPGQPPARPTAQVPVLGRFQFAPGATSGETSGQLPSRAVVDYLISAQGGQTMLANVYSPNGDVVLGVSGVSDGSVLLQTTAGQTGFTGPLPATQDYRLRLAAPPQGSQFTLQVILPARIQFAPGAVSASVPGQLAASQTNFYLANAQGGQTMTVRILSPNNDVFLTVYGLTDGSPLVRSVMGQSEWTGTLPITQDYMIEAVATGPATTYTLEVTIR